MNRSAIAISFLASATFLAGTVAAQDGGLYRWVDEDGKVHFSDRMDAASTVDSYDRFNSQGVRISAPPAPMSRQEMSTMEEARRLAQRDSVLLSSYNSELELLRAHDEQRLIIEQNARNIETNLERLRREISSRSESLNGSATSDPALARLQAQLDSELDALEQLRQRRFDLYEKQNREVERYRELSSSHSGNS